MATVHGPSREGPDSARLAVRKPATGWSVCDDSFCAWRLCSGHAPGLGGVVTGSELRIARREVAARQRKMMEVTDVLTAEEAADFLRVSTKTVLTLARSGTLPGTKVGRAWRFLRADLAAYVHGTQGGHEVLVGGR